MARAPRPSLAPTAPGLPAAALFVVFFLAALAAYLPALRGDFLWDDLGHVTNPALQSWSGLLRIWFEPGATQQYYPLLHSAFWVEHKLWGDATLGYHLVNVLQHALAATLFGVLLRRLAVPGAWFSAALFLLHPVCVESVAWISEQKNTLSLVLYLCAALAYLRFDADRSPRQYALAIVLFAGALLTKTVTASLPAALLVIFWWQRARSARSGPSEGRLDWRRDVLPLLPWFALGAGGGLFTAHFERVLIGAQGADFTLGFADRLVLAGRIFWFYLGKLVWPAELIFVYPRWSIDGSVGWQWLFTAAGLALLGGLVWWQRRSRGPLAAALLFGGSLFPVLGFVNVYPFIFSYVADHFQYLASLAVFALAGAGLARLPGGTGLVVGGTLGLVYGSLTWMQAGTYRNEVTLYEATLRRNPDCWMAHNNLAIVLVEANRAEEALPHYEAALRARPDYAVGEHNLGFALNRLGRHAEAIPHLERALALKPDYASAHNELGAALMLTGRPEEGMSRFHQALRLDPGFGLAHRNLALALAMGERVAEALPHFEEAARLLPGDFEARLQFAMALSAVQRFADAIPQLEAALALAPNSGPAHYQLAFVLRSLGRTAEADAHYQTAIRLDPSLAR